MLLRVCLMCVLSACSQLLYAFEPATACGVDEQRGLDDAQLGMQWKLALPVNYQRGAPLWLEVQAGQIASGHELEVRSPTGHLLGVVSPYGTRGGAAGRYVFPVSLPMSPDLFFDGFVHVYVRVTQSNLPTRQPREGELRALRLLGSGVLTR